MKWTRAGLALIAILLAVVFSFPALAQDQDAAAPADETAAITQDQTPQTVPDQILYESAAQVNLNRQAGSYASARLLNARIQAEGTDQLGVLKQVYDVEIRSGSLKGEQVTISSDVEANPYQLEPKPGDKLVVFIQTDENGEPMIFLDGFDRRGSMYALVALFVLALVALAGWQGFKVAASIIVSILIIGWVLIPAFLRGANPVPIAMALAAALTFLSTGLSIGWTKKAYVTAVGTFGGVVVAWLISVIFTGWAHMSGLGAEEDRLFFSQNPALNPSGLLFAGIIIAAMGVIQDVAVSIASGVEEMRKMNPNAKFRDLFRSGMVVGKDHMAAMANTLIFAYVGASLSTLLLYTQYDASWLKFLNFESVSEEVVRSLAATIGLVFTVPITALLSAYSSLKFSDERRGKTLVHRQE
jgi:uncharacterized membrane protein